MPKWVLDDVTYVADVEGGEFDKGGLRVSVHRSGRKYRVDASIRRANESPFGIGVPDAGLNRTFDTPVQALSEGFRSAIFHLNNGAGRGRVVDAEQDWIHWVYLDDDGKIDWEFMDKLSDDERAEKTNAELPFTPPTSEGVLDVGVTRQVAKSFNARPDALEEGGRNAPGVGALIDGEAAVDGATAANAGLDDFLQRRGMMVPTKRGTGAVEGESGDGTTEHSTKTPANEAAEPAPRVS